VAKGRALDGVGTKQHRPCPAHPLGPSTQTSPPAVPAIPRLPNARAPGWRRPRAGSPGPGSAQVSRATVHVGARFVRACMVGPQGTAGRQVPCPRSPRLTLAAWADTLELSAWVCEVCEASCADRAATCAWGVQSGGPAGALSWEECRAREGPRNEAHRSCFCRLVICTACGWRALGGGCRGDGSNRICVFCHSQVQYAPG
jgi:hypothetical protein